MQKQSEHIHTHQSSGQPDNQQRLWRKGGGLVALLKGASAVNVEEGESIFFLHKPAHIFSWESRGMTQRPFGNNLKIMAAPEK